MKDTLDNRDGAIAVSLEKRSDFKMADPDIYGIDLADIYLNCSFYYPESIPFFKKYFIDAENSRPLVKLDSEDLYQIREQYPPEQPGHVSEIKMLSVAFSDALLPYDRVIVHAVSIIYKGQVWLLTAPAGTGKSTQYKNLRRLHPDQIHILCGDNPILQFMPDGTVLVHHSPWNGKEGFGNRRIAPLSGIVLLEQADENVITPLPAMDAVIPIFNQMNTFLKTEDSVHRVFRMEEHLLTTFPIWKFRNLGNLESSEMLFQLITGCTSGGCSFSRR